MWDIALPASLATRFASLRFRIAAGTIGTCAVVTLLVALALTHGDAPLVLLAAVAAAILAVPPGLALAHLVVSPLDHLAQTTEVRSSTAVDSITPPATVPSVPGHAAALEIARLAAAIEQLAFRPPPESGAQAQKDDVLASVLTAMLDGVLLLDADGHVTYSNEAARRLLLLAPAADGRVNTTVAAFQDDRLTTIAARALRGETLDDSLGLHDAQYTVRLYAAPLNGGGAGAVMVLHDMTEARRLDRVRQEFVANASHELLTPIGTVRALADTLARGGMEDRKAARRFLKQLRVEADRLTALARDLVDLAQAQADELRLDLKPTDVAEVITTVLERLHAPAAKANVSLEAIWEARIPLVLADPARLEQVLINLAQNAIKFTGNGGRVTIATETREDTLLIRVCDTGLGIAAADLPRIFERFYKVRGATGSAGGTGLGLAIVRHLMGAMHGDVTAESAVDQGSTFTITLRRAEPCADGVSGERSTSASASS